MKLDVESSDTIIIGKVQKGDYKMGDLTKIFSILHTQIYADKVLAPIRELVCNAHDSHVAAGTNRRFQVHMPTADECYFSIRDFGTGMTEEEVVELYTTYGASTKDNSNEAVGCFGIGSKAPFAYTDRFEVTAFKDGRMNVYQCLVDEGVPKFIQYDSTDTDEPNGMLIKFDVKKSDRDSFQTAMSKMFFFRGEIEFNNMCGVSFEKIPVFEHDFAFHNGWGVEMGGVLYPISRDELWKVPLLKKIDDPLSWGTGYIIHVDLGDVDITASRESINWTCKSKECLSNKAKKLLDNIESMCRRDMMKHKTIWGKINAYAEFKKRHPFFKGTRTIMGLQGSIPNYTFWGDSEKVSIVTKGYTDSSKSVRALLQNAQTSLSICKPDSSIEFAAVVETGKPTDGIRGYSSDKPDAIVVCVKNEDAVKLLRRLGAPIKDASEFDVYKKERAKCYTSHRDKGENKRRDDTIKGVRLFAGMGRATGAVPNSWIATVLRAEGRKDPIYYVLRDAPAGKFVTHPDYSAVIAGDYAYKTWFDFFTYCGRFYVVSTKVIDRLKEEDVNNRLVDLEAYVHSRVRHKDSIYPRILRYKSLIKFKCSHTLSLEGNIINDYVLSLMPEGDHKAFIKMFMSIKDNGPEKDYENVDELMFDSYRMDGESHRIAREAWGAYVDTLTKYFPLMSDVRGREISDKEKDHVLKYCKMAKAEALAERRKQKSAECGVNENKENNKN